MLDALSIRLKFVLLSGLCLLGVIGLIVSMNFYQDNQNIQLISNSSSSILAKSGEALLQATNYLPLEYIVVDSGRDWKSKNWCRWRLTSSNLKSSVI